MKKALNLQPGDKILVGDKKREVAYIVNNGGTVRIVFLDLLGDVFANFNRAFKLA